MKQVKTDREDVRQLHEAAEEVETSFKGASIGYKGLTITQTWGGAATITIAHRLGRQPVGWIITDRTTAATLHRSAWSATSISLAASGALTATLLVW